MLTLEPFSEDQGRSAVHPARGIPPISFLAPCGFTHPLTRTHVRLLGPCFKTGRMGCPQAGAGSTQVYRRDGACCQPRSTRRHLHEPIERAYRQLGALAAAPIRTGPRPESIGGPAIAVPHPTGDASPAPIRFPPDNFKHSLTLFSKSFSSFPRGTSPRGATGSGHDGALTLSGAPFQGTWARSAAEDASPDYNSDSEPSDFQAGLIPVRSPLLRESLHGRPISAPDAMCPDKGCMVGGDAMRDAPGKACPRPDGFGRNLRSKTRCSSRDSAIHTQVHVHGSFCFAGFDNDPSAGSPTETLLRLLLPLNDKVQWNSRDVAGGEPPTSPRS
ncbi:hypothetical protein L1887_54609 [Cichorium endivia]|nr:hypothetical protein L1887_54609 [Cichorium endivia]